MGRASKDLRAAARYIERYGWVQWQGSTEDGRVCATEALNRVGVTLAAPMRLREFLRYPSIVTWNDNRERTRTQVLIGLRRAAMPKILWPLLRRLPA